jgi:DNA-binding SARP family transcriptional activator
MKSILDRCLTNFAAALEQTNLVVLHPESQFRTPMIAQLLEKNDFRILYYALGHDDISIESLVSGLAHELSYQYPLFGRHLNMVGLGADANSQALVSALCDELAALADKPLLLIFDEYDRSDEADDVQVFVERLTEVLPANCHIVINSRTLPRLPLVSMMAHHRALILLDDQVVRRDFFGAASQDGVDIEVYGLGPGFVIVNGKLVEDWEGHLPRLLFFFALDKPVITRSEICHSFWPDLEIEQAVNVFHVTKRRLHKALGVDFDVLLHDEGYYRLNPAFSIDYDVMSFTASLLEARSDDTDGAQDKWQRVIDLYRGPYLQGHHEPWIDDRRRDFRAGYIEALSNLANIRIAAARLDHGLALLLRAVGADNSREALHLQIMELYQRLERRNEGIAHYKKMVEAFRKDGRKPLAESEMLYKQLVTG